MLSSLPHFHTQSLGSLCRLYAPQPIEIVRMLCSFMMTVFLQVIGEYFEDIWNDFHTLQDKRKSNKFCQLWMDQRTESGCLVRYGNMCSRSNTVRWAPSQYLSTSLPTSVERTSYQIFKIIILMKQEALVITFKKQRLKSKTFSPLYPTALMKK